MRRAVVLCALSFALAVLPAMGAGTDSGVSVPKDFLTSAACGDFTPATVALAGDDLPAAPASSDFSPRPRLPQVAPMDNCPDRDSCSCGIAVFDLEDPGCITGVNLGVDHCGSFHCPDGQTVFFRTCPCEGCAATWNAIYCSN